MQLLIAIARMTSLPQYIRLFNISIDNFTNVRFYSEMLRIIILTWFKALVKTENYAHICNIY